MMSRGLFRIAMCAALLVDIATGALMYSRAHLMPLNAGSIGFLGCIAITQTGLAGLCIYLLVTGGD